MREENNVCGNSGTLQGPACLGHMVIGPIGGVCVAAGSTGAIPQEAFFYRWRGGEGIFDGFLSCLIKMLQ